MEEKRKIATTTQNTYFLFNFAKEEGAHNDRIIV
jgi:hypothetical protein